MSNFYFTFAKIFLLMSQAEENYLKGIFILQSEFGNGVSTNLIANKMITKASSVTDMLKKLTLKKLVNYKKYQGASLTKKGYDIAIKIVRKHRLWETFLVNKLDFNWDEVHHLAEQLEHIKSDKLVDKIDALLNYPKQDPHGDPIPDNKGNLPKTYQDSLANMDEKSTCILKGVKDSSEAFLKYLDLKNIAINTKIKIIDIEPFDKTMEIKVNKLTFSISNTIAQNLIVKKQ